MKASTHDKLAGAAKIIAGDVKFAAGKAVGNPRLKTEGAIEKIEGQTQTKISAVEKTLGK